MLELFGKRQWFELAEPSVRSFKDRAEFARYHYHEAKDLVRKYVEAELSSGRSLLELHADEARYDEFSYMMLRLRANLIAAIQSLHAMPDTCANMLHWSVANGRRFPDPRR